MKKKKMSAVKRVEGGTRKRHEVGEKKNVTNERRI